MNMDKYQMVKTYIEKYWSEDKVKRLTDALRKYPGAVHTIREAIGDFNIIEYKGYYTKVHYSHPDQVLYGKIEGIKDLICFHCDDAKEADAAFQEAVDDYLSFCKDLGREPDIPDPVKLIRLSGGFDFEEAVQQILENADNPANYEYDAT